MRELIPSLKQRLLQELPGRVAQKAMMPGDTSSERFNVERMKNARLSGVMVLFYQRNREWYIPLTQRHEYKGTHSGQVSLPGGKMDQEDLSIEATARRETFEEIGVSDSLIITIGQLTPLYIPPSNFTATPIVGMATSDLTFNLDPYEVKELIEVPIDMLRDKTLRKEKEIVEQGKLRINAPYFDIFGKVVWGATAMILSELIFILDEIDSSY